MEDNTYAKFEFLASFILPNGILDWFDFVKADEEPVEKKDCIYKSTLHIYLDENGKNVILNLYPTTAEGTRYSEEFAVFLKVLHPRGGNKIQRTQTPHLSTFC